MPNEPLNFAEFKLKLDALCEVVTELICGQDDWDVTKPIFYEVANSLENRHCGVGPFRAFFFNFSQGLLRMNDGEQMRTHADFLKQCEANKHVHSPSIQDADYVEYLTAASLAIYFLGQPFSHPWEHVLKRVKDSVGGLPNGACVGKAIGDVVRSARITNLRARQRTSTGSAPVTEPQPVRATEQQSDPATEPLLVHSHMPIILHESYVRTADEKGCLPDSAHILAHCYELLQIRLYANEGLPFRYFVPTVLFQAKLKWDNPHNLELEWGKALDWMRRQLGRTTFDGQYVVLLDTERVPPVFINGTAGIFTSPRTPEGTIESHKPAPLPATFLKKTRMRLHRDSLTNIRVADMINLLDVCRNAETRGQAFQKLLNP